ncbi:MAG: tRNA 2-thiouridine synthesizing protein B [Kiritimatiellia bacterium]|jgi:tRNA 2-thiouridine synthesizing protein B
MLHRVLHSVNKSPFSSTLLKQCLDRLSESDGLILLEDGVYGALLTHPHAQQLQSLNACYAIKRDLVARGLESEALLANITLIDYEEFVALCVDYELTHSWY